MPFRNASLPPAFLSVLLLAMLTVPAGAAPTGRSDHVVVELVSERASIRPGTAFQVGLLMKLQRGWHTYWKQPGDAGLPLHIDWKLPPGFSAGPIEWPAPERIPTGGLMSYGYEREVLLPVTITPPSRIPAESVTVAGTFDWLECKDLCLSASASLDLRIPVRQEQPKPSAMAFRFEAARDRVPRPTEGWTLKAIAGPKAIELSFRPPPGVAPRGGHFFADQPLTIEHAGPQGFERTHDDYRLTVPPAENAPGPPKRLTGVLVLEGVPRSRGRAWAVDVAAVPGNPEPAPPQEDSTGPWRPPYAMLIVFAGLAFVLFMRRRRGKTMLGDPP